MKERVPQDAPASPADVREPTTIEYRDLEIAKNCLAVAVAYMAEPPTPHTLAMALVNIAIAHDRIRTWDGCPSRVDRGRATSIAREWIVALIEGRDE